MGDHWSNTIAVSTKNIYLDDKNRNLIIIDKETLKLVGVLDLENKGMQRFL